MNTQYDPRTRELLELLHRGFMAIQHQALEAGHKQIADLADAMEIIPHIMMGKPDDEELLRFVLENYRDKYPEGSHYLLRGFVPDAMLQTT